MIAVLIQSAIRITAVRRPCAVHKGDRVMIEARQGNFSIQPVFGLKCVGETGQDVAHSFQITAAKANPSFLR